MEENSENNDAQGIPLASAKCKKESNSEGKSENNDAQGIPGASGKCKKESNNDAPGIPGASAKCKMPSDFFRIATTTALINECKQQTRLDEVYYDLKKGTPKQFAGTYVHELLYDHFLVWLDPRYAIKISIILKQIHQDANRKLLQEKDNAITRLGDKIDKQSVQIDKQSADIAKLLNYSNAITKQNTDLLERADHLQITADITQEDLDKSLIYQKEILYHLVDK